MQVDTSIPSLVIDASYYIFHRYYATLRWYSFQTKDADKNPNITKDPVFAAAFVKHVTQDLKKWRKEHNVRSGNVYFCFDCPRNEIWRNEHHDQYKGTRVQAQSFDGNVFPLFYEWFDKNKTAEGVESLFVPSLEADDVAYLSAMAITQLDPSAHVIVLTNDGDYLQMRSDRIKIVNAQGMDLSKRSIGTPQQDLIYKIVLGDPSDNIKPICNRLGASMGKKLALMSEEERWAWIQKKGETCEEAYRRNERLISFLHIPQCHVERWREIYTWHKK